VLVFAERVVRAVGERVLAAFKRLVGLFLTAIAIGMLLRGDRGVRAPARASQLTRDR